MSKEVEGIAFHSCGMWFVEVDGNKYYLGMSPHPILYRGHDENKKIVVVIVDENTATFQRFAN